MSPFRTANNVLLTKALFFETTLADKSTVVYSLKDRDHTVDGVTYPSLFQKYLEANDPTEYRFATQYLDGLYHWEVLCECTWFKPYLERWRHELSLRMKSEALARIMKEAKTTSKDSFMANRYLLEKAWEPHGDPKAKRGRPSKEEIKQAATDIARAESNFLDDFKRVSFQ